MLCISDLVLIKKIKFSYLAVNKTNTLIYDRSCSFVLLRSPNYALKKKKKKVNSFYLGKNKPEIAESNLFNEVLLLTRRVLK